MSQELLLELRRRGIRLRLADDRVEVLAPAGALTPALRAQLREERASLLSLLRGADTAAGLTGIVPDPDNAGQPFELTDIQHAYWVGSNPAVELGGVSTHFYFELERDGLDPLRLGVAFRRVIDRHPMLRAVVQPDGRQRVLAEVPGYEIGVTDLRALTPPERDAELARIRADLGHRAPVADRWPLFEIRLSRLAGTRTRMHLSVNMLIMDASSLSLMFADWRRFYEDPEWEPEPLPFTFRDYVQASQRLRQGASYRAAEQYWLSRMDALPAAPALPLARQPGQLTRPEFTGRSARLTRRQWDFVKDVARRRRLTPSVVVLTAFADILRTWSAQPAFTVNVTLFHRPPVHPGINTVIGDFTSLTMLEVRPAGAETFTDRARRIQDQLMRDLEHVAFSGVRVLRERVRRSGGGPTAAMPVVFTAAVPLTTDSTDDGSRPFFGEMVHSISQTPQVHLDHQVTEELGALLVNWDCVEALFPAGLLDDAFAAYRLLLDRISGDEAAWDAPAPVPLLPERQARERERANDTAGPIGTDTLYGIVAAQARRTPDAVAVIAGDGALTYREVMDRAHRLAGRLGALGAGRGTVVGIVLDKGCDQVSAVLGVTGSGAAYLPIDPSWPAARRGQLIERCGVRIVVTAPDLRDGTAFPPGLRLLTAADPEVRAADPAPPAHGPAPGDLAYVIFTSGSTGRPKGVMIDHRGAVNTVADINTRFRVGPGDRVLALSALSFDLSVYDIFGVLAAGGTVVMPDPAGERDGAHWSDLIDRHAVTIWNSVPALMQTWLDSRAADARPTGIRLAMLSGDWIPVALPDAVRAAHPGTEVISLGGATEASIWSVHYPIGEVPAHWSRIPYGRPLTNQTLHVYDDRLAPCPVWTTGELYIGGTGVALGYWDDPEQTAHRFITHPVTGERLYRTGDLARYLPGGDVEFLGRADFQVKLNGYRIELDEIAHALRQDDGVHAAVVDVAEHPGTGRRQLVAYIVPTGPGRPNGAAFADPQLWPELVAAGHDEVRRAAAELAGPVHAFESWWRTVEALCPSIIARTLTQLGRFVTAGDTGTAEEIVRRAGIQPRHTGLVEQWLVTLAGAGSLVATGRPGEYTGPVPFDAAELERSVAPTLAAVEATGPDRGFLDYLRECADRQVALLRGEVSPLQLLLPDDTGRVTDSLYATNPSSRIQNRTVARIARELADRLPDGQRLRILEVGAGTGATSQAILGAVPDDRIHYRFTDISTFFTSRARRRLAAHPAVEYGVYDIDRDPAGQGVPAGGADLLVAANVLHDAKDLGRTLERLRTLLAPGGVLVAIEGTANSLIQLISVGFIEGFAHHQGRHELPLRGVERWREELHRAGYATFAALPDGAPACAAMPQHVLIAGAPGAEPPLSPERLREALSAVLPEYMVPRHYVTIDRIPLSANGKVDRAALPAPWGTAAGPEPVAPRDDLEDRVLGIWQDVIGRAGFGVEESFFELGGDSLHAVRILARLRDELGLEVTADDGMRMLFDQPSVSGLVAALRALGGRR